MARSSSVSCAVEAQRVVPLERGEAALVRRLRGQRRSLAVSFLARRGATRRAGAHQHEGGHVVAEARHRRAEVVVAPASARGATRRAARLLAARLARWLRRVPMRRLVACCGSRRCAVRAFGRRLWRALALGCRGRRRLGRLAAFSGRGLGSRRAFGSAVGLRLGALSDSRRCRPRLRRRRLAAAAPRGRGACGRPPRPSRPDPGPRRSSAGSGGRSASRSAPPRSGPPAGRW